MRRFIAGVVLLYAGFAVFFLGFMMSGPTNPLLGAVTRLIPLIGNTSFTATIFEFLGGLIGVTGFILCAIPAKPTPPPPPPPPTIIIQKIHEPETPKTTDATPSVPKCKFCGAQLRAGNIFCPSCQRAQA